MRIAVIGNCQAFIMAECITRFMPGAEVTPIFRGRLVWGEAVEAELKAVQTADLVLDQARGYALDAAEVSPVKADMAEAVKAARGRTSYWPNLTFSGYHPDAISLRDHNGTYIATPAGAYHSLIIAACYLGGGTESYTRSRFNSLSYAKLGYFDRFDQDVYFLSERFKPFGMDFEALVQTWRGPEPFMHSFNHPTVRPIADITRHTLETLSLPVAFDPASLPPDQLGMHRLAVYPELARRLGVEGRLAFMRQADGGFGSVEEMIAGCFRAYDRLPIELLRGDPQIVRAAAALGLDPLGGRLAQNRAERAEQLRADTRALPGVKIEVWQPTAACHLLDGWGGVEPGLGSWTRGVEAGLRLALAPGATGPVTFKLWATPFVHPNHPQLTVDVAINDADLGQWRFYWEDGAGAGAVENVVSFPSSLAPDGDLRVTLRINSPNSPLNLGLGEDSRMLGLAAHWFGVDYAVEPA